jgi:hypothetical protein
MLRPAKRRVPRGIQLLKVSLALRSEFCLTQTTGERYAEAHQTSRDLEQDGSGPARVESL